MLQPQYFNLQAPSRLSGGVLVDMEVQVQVASINDAHIWKETLSVYVVAPLTTPAVALDSRNG